MPGLDAQAISAKSHHIRARLTGVARQPLLLTVVEASSNPLGVHEKRSGVVSMSSIHLAMSHKPRKPYPDNDRAKQKPVRSVASQSDHQG